MDFVSFCHYSDKKLDFPLSFPAEAEERNKETRNAVQETEEERLLRLVSSMSSKPRKGYWFARGDEWIDWCNGAQFFPHHYQYKYAFGALRNPERVLVIRNSKEAREFEARFGADPFSGIVAKELNMVLIRIDWESVEKEYDAVYLPLLDYIDRKGLSVLCSTLDVDSIVVFELENVALRFLEHREEGWVKTGADDSDEK